MPHIVYCDKTEIEEVEKVVWRDVPSSEIKTVEVPTYVEVDKVVEACMRPIYGLNKSQTRAIYVLYTFCTGG